MIENDRQAAGFSPAACRRAITVPAARRSLRRSLDELLHQLIELVAFVVERAVAAVHERHEPRMGNFSMHLLRLAERNDLVMNAVHDQRRHLDARQVNIQIEVP